MGNTVVIAAAVAGGTYDQCVGCINGIFKGLDVGAAAPAIVDDISAHVIGIFDGRNGIGGGPAAPGIQKPQGHNFGRPADAGNADTVIAYCRNGSGNVGAVAVGIAGIIIV